MVLDDCRDTQRGLGASTHAGIGRSVIGPVLANQCPRSSTIVVEGRAGLSDLSMRRGPRRRVAGR